MRLINADALKQEFPQNTDWEYPVNTNEYVCEIIDSQPTIEPERKRGRWEGTLLVKNSGRVKCSECYAIYDLYTQAQYFKYCPNCGADMRV